MSVRPGTKPQFESPLVLLLVAAGAISLVVHSIEGDADVPNEPAGNVPRRGESTERHR